MSDTVIDGTTGEVVAMESGTAAAYVAKQDAAMLDVQVATAKQYPRSVQRFQSELEAWCTLNRDASMECFFMMPRDGKQVVGPSVRFAELVQAAYGNLVVDSQIIEEARDYVVVGATCRDLERNVASRAQVRRSILNRKKERYSAPMIETTIMAASAIARRNAIFQTVPKALWSPMYDKARRVAHGDESTFAERRQSITKALREAGCDMPSVKAFMGGKDNKDLSKDDVLILELKLRAIEANEITPESAFPKPIPDEPEAGASAKSAAEAIASKRRKKPKSPEDGPSGGDPGESDTDSGLIDTDSTPDPVDEAFGL